VSSIKPAPVGVDAQDVTATSTATAPRASWSKPQRSPELAHMSLDRLRAYRRTLLQEELRTSYWRRLLQGRRDLLRADSRPGDLAGVNRVLADEGAGSGRQAIMMLHPEGGMPILPRLPELWASGLADDSDEARAQLFAGLANAENVLSSYREALHRRLDRATADLVARYAEDPTLCFVALPSPR
jgi:hypothetical protein